MDRNQKVKVAAHAHQAKNRGKEGYFQFYGQGASAGCAICTEAPTVDGTGVFFVVGENEITPVQES